LVDPDVAQEDGRGPHLAAVQALFLEDKPLEAVDEAVVVVKQDGGVEDARHPALGEDRRGRLHDQGPVLDLGLPAAGQGRGDDPDDRPLGQVRPLAADVLVAQQAGAGGRLAVAQDPLDVAVAGHAVAPGVEGVGPDQDGAVRVDHVDDVEAELGLDLDQLVVEVAAVAVGGGPHDLGRLGQVLDDLKALLDLLVVELGRGSQGVADGLAALPDHVGVDDVEADDERQAAHQGHDGDQADHQLDADVGPS